MPDNTQHFDSLGSCLRSANDFYNNYFPDKAVRMCHFSCSVVTCVIIYQCFNNISQCYYSKCKGELNRSYSYTVYILMIAIVNLLIHNLLFKKAYSYCILNLSQCSSCLQLQLATSTRSFLIR